MKSFDYDTEERNFSYDQLELVHIDEHFYLLFIGSAFSLVVFFCEVGKCCGGGKDLMLKRSSNWQKY